MLEGLFPRETRSHFYSVLRITSQLVMFSRKEAQYTPTEEEEKDHGEGKIIEKVICARVE